MKQLNGAVYCTIDLTVCLSKVLGKWKIKSCQRFATLSATRLICFVFFWLTFCYFWKRDCIVIKIYLNHSSKIMRYSHIPGESICCWWVTSWSINCPKPVKRTFNLVEKTSLLVSSVFLITLGSGRGLPSDEVRILEKPN